MCKKTQKSKINCFGDRIKVNINNPELNGYPEIGSLHNTNKSNVAFSAELLL